MTAPARPRRRWRRRLVWCVALAVAARVSLSMLLPWLADLGAGTVGLSIGWRSASLSLLGLSLHLEDVVVADRENPHEPALLVAQELTADVSAWQLLHGEFGVVDVALSGCTVQMKRRADGSLSLPRGLQPGPAAPRATPDPEVAPAAPKPLRFELPFQVASARVHDLRVLMHDEAGATPRDIDLTLDVDVVDLGRRGVPGHLLVRATAPGLFDQLRLQATAAAAENRASLQWQLALNGARLAAFDLPATARAALGDATTAGIELAGSASAEAGPAAGDPVALQAELQAGVLLDAAERLHLRAAAGPAPFAAGRASLPFHAELHCAELVDRLRLADGRLDVAEHHLAAGARLDCSTLTLRQLEPWLAARGIEIAAAGLDATAKFAAELDDEQGTRLGARLEDVVVRHGADQVALPKVELVDVRIGPGAIDVGALRIDGPGLAIAKRADGSLAVAGVSLRPARGAPAGDVAPPPPAPAVPQPPVAIHLGTFDWRGAEVHFTDETLPGAPALTLTGVTATGADLGFGSERAAGRASFSCRLPGIAETLRADVHVQPRPTGAATEVQCRADGLTARALEPWLAPRGVAPQWRNGALKLSATAEVGFADGGLQLDARVADVRLDDGDEALLGLRSAEVRGLRVSPAGLDLGEVRVDEPLLVVDRGAATLVVAGVRLEPPPTASAAAPAPTPPPAPAPASGDAALHHGALTVAGAELAWRDHRDGERTVRLGVDVSLGAERGGGAPAPFEVHLRLPDAVPSLVLRGDLLRTGGALRCQGELEASGVRGAGLQPLLPPHVACDLVDGTLAARFAAEVHPADAGVALDLQLDGLRLGDRGEELAAVDRLEVHAPSLGAALVHVEQCRIDGVRASCASVPGGFAAAGLRLHAVPAPTATPPAEPAPVAAPAARPPVALPALRVDRLELGLERLQWRDRTTAEGEPLQCSARVRLLEPWATRRDLPETPPAKFGVDAAAAPLLRSLHLDLEVAPFLLQPECHAALRAEGLDLAAAAAVVPSLAGRLGASTRDATLSARVHGALDLRRRDPRVFDFGKPFGGELHLEALELRDATSGGVLAGLGSLDAEARAIDPVHGDVLLKQVTIADVRGDVLRTADGLTVAGLVLRPSPAAPAAAPATPPPAPTTPAGSAGPEFAIDRLRVQGAVCRFRDTTTTPATDLPIADVDLEVQRFGTRTLREPEPFGFSLALRGGDVELPRRIVRSSVFAGVVGSATDLLTLRRDEHERERRPLFQDLLVQGQLQLFPLPKGNCRLELVGFEMPAIRGLAATGGVAIDDGQLDLSARADCRGAEGIDAGAGITFTWLSMTEPPNGPISTYLKLPAPLATVLFLLRNDADEQRLPVRLHLPAQGVAASAVAEAAIEAVALAIGDAVTRSPLRAASAVTGLLGLGGSRTDLADLVVALDGPAGSADLDLVPLDDLLEKTAHDPEVKFVLTHELGQADFERARALANPPKPVVRAAVDRLRERRAELGARRRELATDLAARYAAARHDAVAAQERLATLDDELAGVERALDEALALLDDDSGRTAARLARRAAIELGEQRLARVREQLAAHLPGDAAGRIELRPARGIPAADVPEGGRIVVVPRRRAPDAQPPR